MKYILITSGKKINNFGQFIESLQMNYIAFFFFFTCTTQEIMTWSLSLTTSDATLVIHSDVAEQVSHGLAIVDPADSLS